MSPMPPVGAAVSGIFGWAAVPARTARASGVHQSLASTEAGHTPRRPYLARMTGWAGGRRSGARSAWQISSMWPASGPITRR